MFNAHDLAYAAGYIDGDGCLYIGTYQSSKCIIYEYSIQVLSTNRNVLIWLKSIFGGAIRSKKRLTNHKTTYTWTIKNKESIECIQAIQPYLRAKYHESQCFIEFALHVNTNKGLKLDKFAIDHRINLIQKIRNLRHDLNMVENEYTKQLKNIRPSLTPSESDFAYLAGLIDAEGSITIKKWLPKNKPNSVYAISLEIGNTNKLFFDWLMMRFGGNISFVKSKASNKKNSATWSIKSKRLFFFLPKIVTFLKYKQPVCKKIIEFYTTNLPNGGDRHSIAFKSAYKETIRLRELIVDQVHILNAKGHRSS